MDLPLLTLAGARDKAPTMLDGIGDITVYFRGGYYPFAQTVVFGLDDSGSENQVITYRNYPGETPIFTSGLQVTGWRKLLSGDPGHDEIPTTVREHVCIADVSDVLQKTGLFHYLLDNKAEWLRRAMTDGFSSPRKHKPGEDRTLKFTLTPEMMSFFDYEGKLTLEPGDFRLEVGGCSPGKRGQELGAPAPATVVFRVS